eukprot:12447096-Alexandrium_andersonii.AAC.1
MGERAWPGGLRGGAPAHVPLREAPVEPPRPVRQGAVPHGPHRGASGCSAGGRGGALGRLSCRR